MLEPGHKLGTYKIIRSLGSGGMADVYEVEDVRLGRHLALKLLPVEMSRSKDLIARFEKEVQAAAALNHPNIVTLFEFGHEEHYHFYTMQLLPGGDLREKIRKGMDLRDVFTTMRGVTSAFVHAHERGFVHRDVKPENIMFDEHGTPVLTDFGIAKAMDSQTRMTMTGMAIGTPRYISPEQARGYEIDGRSDLYALGCIFYEMLAGKSPYDANDAFALVFQHISDPIPQLPEEFAQLQPLLESLMAKDKADRCADARTLLAELDRVIPRDWTGRISPSLTSGGLTAQISSPDVLKTSTQAIPSRDQTITDVVPADAGEAIADPTDELDATIIVEQLKSGQEQVVDITDPDLGATVILDVKPESAQSEPAEDVDSFADTGPLEPAEAEFSDTANLKTVITKPVSAVDSIEQQAPSDPAAAVQEQLAKNRSQEAADARPAQATQLEVPQRERPKDSAKKGRGVLMIVVIVLAVLAILAFIFWSDDKAEKQAGEKPQATAAADGAAQIDHKQRRAAELYAAALAKEKKQQYQAAKTEYQRIVSLFPGTPSAEQAEKALQRLDKMPPVQATTEPAVTPAPATPMPTLQATAKPEPKPTASPKAVDRTTAAPKATARAKATPRPAATPHPAKKMSQDAASLQARGQLSQAKAKYQDIIRKYPTVPEAAQARSRIRDIDNTLAARKRAEQRQRQEQQAKSRMEQAQMLEAADRLEDALNTYRDVLINYKQTSYAAIAEARAKEIDNKLQQRNAATPAPTPAPKEEEPIPIIGF